MAGMETRGRRDHAPMAPDALDLRFPAGAMIVPVAAIALSLTMGVPIVSEVAMFVAPWPKGERTMSARAERWRPDRQFLRRNVG